MAEKIDSKLQQIALNQTDTLRYYSFVKGSPNKRRRALSLNQFMNKKMKYKFIKNVDVKKTVKVNGNEMTMRKVMLNTNAREIRIFEVIE